MFANIDYRLYVEGEDDLNAWYNFKKEFKKHAIKHIKKEGYKLDIHPAFV